MELASSDVRPILTWRNDFMLRFHSIADRYEVRRQIGVGGMARVFLARDAVLHRDVAVKVLNEAASADPAFVARFRREAQAAGLLQSPHIVQVYDWGRTAEDEWPVYYLVMEYVAGPNLKEVIRNRGALPEGEALRIAADIAAALDVAHRHGIIHRDIKPQNVLLGPGGEVKVADFGIARATGLTQLTTTQSAVYGSAHYLSPEQVQRGAADGRSDIYSLGAVLYEMLTGHEPFAGESLLEVVLQHVSGEVVPPSSLREGISTSSDRIVLKALEKDPDARFSSASALRSALLQARSGVLRPAVPAQATSAARDSTPPEPTDVPRATRTRVRAEPAFARRDRSAGTEPKRSLLPILLAALVLVLGVGLGVQRALSGVTTGASHGASGNHPSVSPVASHVRVTATSSRQATERGRRKTTGAGPRRVRGSAGVASGHRNGRGHGTKAGTSSSSGPAAAPIPAPTSVAGAAPLPTAASTVPAGPPASSGRGTGGAVLVASGSGSPQQAVLAFYADVGTHNFAAAAGLWTPALQSRDPPPTYIDDRFRATTRIVVENSYVARVAGDTATVNVSLVEYLQGGATRTFVGSWDLVRTGGTWLLDNPRF